MDLKNLMAPPTNRVPVRLRREVQSVLLTRAQLARRVRELSREIEHDFAGTELVAVAVLNGTVLFLADLIRNLSLPMRLDFIGVSSYGSGTDSGAASVATTTDGSAAGVDSAGGAAASAATSTGEAGTGEAGSGATG